MITYFFHDFDWDSFPFPNPLLGGRFARKIILSIFHYGNELFGQFKRYYILPTIKTSIRYERYKTNITQST